MLELRAMIDGSSSTHDVDIGRDGWRASGTSVGSAPTRDADGVLQSWLTDASGTNPLVTAGPGRIAIALRSLGTLAGDPAAFAVSWSQLFDDSALLPSGCVPLSERISAGDGMEYLPVYTHPSDSSSNRWPAMIAMAALVLTLLALAVREPMRRGVLVSSEL
jgi:hypothetical protein